MNIEDSIKILKEFNKIKINSYAMQFVNISYPDLQEAIETLLTVYEKEKEKNMELTNSYNQAIKETNEENRRCMLLAVENQDLKEKNKKLNISRLELIISQLPDTTETYKKYRKELDELLKEE